LGVQNNQGVQSAEQESCFIGIYLVIFQPSEIASNAGGQREIPAEKETIMKNVLQIVLLTLALAGAAAASWGPPATPEISAGGGASAIGLIAGVMLVMRSRRKKQ
jgi:membrane associated rhomboid family serine protease